ncbi:MAG TPA: winged helix-turn-helix domain-containing protein [Candidatus Eremiobacteraceae bacterium]|nr:winged helix-turn-helix domain-containing protein [Candidatus Eremiobacteraceae bacterium]
MPGAKEPVTLISFGPFEADLHTQELRKLGVRLRLPRQSFQILKMLLEHRGELVTREELRAALWPADTFVDFEHGLNAAINRLREALGDEADNPVYVETLPRRGYRFTGLGAQPNDRKPVVKPPTVAEQPAQADLQSNVQPTPATGRRMTALTLSLGLLIFAVFVAGLWLANTGKVRQRLFGGEAASRIESLAVLPLANLSSDPEQEYFADGITEELTMQLGQISALRVISRQSTMRYKGTKKTAPQIAQELKVEGIVEGSILRAGNQVRISVQLIDAGKDKQLWAESYQRELGGVLALQSEVARTIAVAIRVKATPQETELLRSARSLDPQAQEAYLKGRFYLNRWPQPDFDQCSESFQHAIEIDPMFADAQAGLSRCYGFMAWSYPVKDVIPRAKEAAQEAIRLNPSQAEAYATLGGIATWFEWNWGEAGEDLQKAVELNPSLSYSRGAYSMYLAFLGHREAAIREAKAAVELDPTSVLANRSLGIVYQLSREYAEYATQAKATLQLAPEDGILKGDLAWAYALEGKRNEALDQIKAGASPVDRANVLAALGERTEALRAFKESQPQTWASAYSAAYVYALLGETDQAIAMLQQAYDEHSPNMVALNTSPAFDSLRGDARFKELVRRMDYPKYFSPTKQ